MSHMCKIIKIVMTVKTLWPFIYFYVFICIAQPQPRVDKTKHLASPSAILSSTKGRRQNRKYLGYMKRRNKTEPRFCYSMCSLFVETTFP